MLKLLKTQTLSKAEQYLILEWLDIAILRTERFEIVLETESLSA